MKYWPGRADMRLSILHADRHPVSDLFIAIRTRPAKAAAFQCPIGPIGFASFVARGPRTSCL